MTRATTLIVVVALLAGVGGFFASRHFLDGRPPGNPDASRVVGEHYGALRLGDLDGRARSLGEWDGQVRLVNFWATWCAPCVKEMPLLDAARREYGGQGLEVIGIALDEPDAVRAFIAQLDIAYPILLDVPGTTDASVRMGNDRGVLPYSVLLGRDGRILASRVGDFDDAAALRAWLAPHLRER